MLGNKVRTGVKWGRTTSMYTFHDPFLVAVLDNFNFYQTDFNLVMLLQFRTRRSGTTSTNIWTPYYNKNTFKLSINTNLPT